MGAVIPRTLDAGLSGRPVTVQHRALATFRVGGIPVHKHRSLIAVLVCLALAAAACGDDDQTANDSPPRRRRHTGGDHLDNLDYHDDHDNRARTGVGRSQDAG